jgi:hypothetical protein
MTAMYRLSILVLFLAVFALGCGSAPKNTQMPDGEKELMRDKDNEDPLNEPAMPMKDMSQAERNITGLVR